MALRRLLIVEEQDAIARQLGLALSDEYEASVADTGTRALDLAASVQPDLVLLDLGLSPEARGTAEGLPILNELIQRDRRVKIVVTTGSQDKEAALQAIHLGAYDYQHKPVDLDQLRIVLRRAAYVQRLERENDARTQAAEMSSGCGRLLGISDAMRNLFHQLERVARTDTPVLIEGENGTGKDLVAQTIHERSRRHQGPFVPINCAALPGELLEVTLFGRDEDGSRGGHSPLRGQIDLAEPGTVCLNDIGVLDMVLQSRLLQLMQEHEVDRTGGREPVPVDVRVISTTRIDLPKLVAEGRFREELYYRLAGVTLRVPPLRERGEDMVLLANALLRRFAREAGDGTLRGFMPEALEAIKSYRWPGNVRELESKLQRAVLIARGAFIEAGDLGLPGQEPREFSLRAARAAVERQVLVDALARTAGNVSHAARTIGVTRPTFHNLMAKYGVQAQTFRRGSVQDRHERAEDKKP